MGGTTIELRFTDAAELEAHWRDHLSHGAAWLAGRRLERDTPCELILIVPGGARLALDARVVFADDQGAGLALDGFGAELRERLEALIQVAAAAGTDAPDPDADASADDTTADTVDADAEAHFARDPIARNVHERLRGLTFVQQVKVARDGEPHERIVLERMYGKTVWDTLLHNPRLTHPEVARIARMGALPRPLMELIVGNAAWLKNPEVRRALLGNPRLAPDQIPRVLRLLPRHELKLVPQQTAYPAAVRDVARRLLHGGGGD